MSKKEFIESLREYLSYELPERLVSGNIRKYEEYFDDQTKAGRSAAEVAAELGDPKLIARSLIDAEKSGADGIPNSEDDPNFAAEIDLENKAGQDTSGADSDAQNGASGQGNTRVYSSRGCLVPILIMIFILILIILFFASGIWIWVGLGILIISAVVAVINSIRRK